MLLSRFERVKWPFTQWANKLFAQIMYPMYMKCVLRFT